MEAFVLGLIVGILLMLLFHIYVTRQIRRRLMEDESNIAMLRRRR